MKKTLSTIGLAILLSGCMQVKDNWVDYDAYYGDWTDEQRETMFCPYSQQLDDERTGLVIEQKLAQLESEQPALDSIDANGQRIPRQTTSTNAVGLAKSIFSLWHNKECVSYSGTYNWYNQETGDAMTLSGRIVLPANKRASRIVLVSHFTIGSNAEAPSMSFPLEGILAARGLAVFIPDYEGYGVTANRVHPYLCSDITASQVTTMYFTALEFLKHINAKPEHDEVILMGYSQGGAVTMAVARKFEYEYPDVKLRVVIAGGGPYDICATYDQLIENNFTDYPCAIPMIIQGMNIGHNLGLDYAQFFQQNTLDHMDDWINSKKYTMAEITRLMGTKRMSDIMTEAACNKVSDGMRELYMAMLNNSISTGYYPQAPVYLFHSIDDNVVPFVNATNMLSVIQGYSNVSYNFGHYGNHVAGYLRFLYTSINLLQIYGDIDKK